MRSQNYIKRAPQSADDGARSHNDAGSAIKAIRDLIAALAIAVEATEAVAANEVNFIGDGVDFFAEVDRFESQMITQALRLSHGSQKRAARLLGLNATTLNSKIKALNINWKTYGDRHPRGAWGDNLSYRGQPIRS
jgi:DNA-binding NtrC family response regulator